MSDSRSAAEKEVFAAEGEKIRLRPMREEDCGKVAAWRSCDRVRSRYIYREIITPEQEVQYYRNHVCTGEILHFMICEKESGRPVGCVVFNNPEPEENRMESGLFIGEEDALGKGYGADALKTACDYVFAHWPFGNREGAELVSRIYCTNAASEAVHARAGYVHCGVLKDVLSTDGTRADMYQMKLVR